MLEVFDTTVAYVGLGFALGSLICVLLLQTKTLRMEREILQLHQELRKMKWEKERNKKEEGKGDLL